MPIKLAVCFLILGLMVPTLMGVVEDSQQELSLTEMTKEAEKLRSAIGKAYYEDSTVYIELSLPAGQSLIVGGEGPERYTIMIQTDDRTIETVYLERPTVGVLNGRTVITGDTTIIVSMTTIDGEYGSVVDVA